MHEIIALQLGQQSNYLATHFWNSQESYFTYSSEKEILINHDVHWRAGLGADGTETFMPRTVIYDLKGGFGTLRKMNTLYEIVEEGDPQALWPGKPVLHKQDPIPQSAYQQSLDAGAQPPRLTTDSVRYWSDFNRVYFHPRSIVQLNEFELNSSHLPFEQRSTGEELFRTLDKEHDLVDRDLRPFVEEADRIQGFQLMTSFDDAWGGFATEYAERLRDEYGKAGLWVWGLQEPLAGVGIEKGLITMSNQTRTLTEMYKHASVMVPVTVPSRLSANISLNKSCRWHSSAIMASAIETATLPSRLKDRENRDTLGGMTDLLNLMGRQSMATLHMSVSDRTDAADYSASRQRSRYETEDEDGLQAGEVQLDMDFSPSEKFGASRRRGGKTREPRVFSQLVTARGYDRFKDEADEIVNGGLLHANGRDIRRPADDPFTRTYRTPLKFTLLDSFPRILHVDEEDGESAAVDITASLRTDEAVHDRLKGLREWVSRFRGLEDREGLVNDLAQMADEYHEGWSSGSDGDDDE